MMLDAGRQRPCQCGPKVQHVVQRAHTRKRTKFHRKPRQYMPRLRTRDAQCANTQDRKSWGSFTRACLVRPNKSGKVRIQDHTMNIEGLNSTCLFHGRKSKKSPCKIQRDVSKAFPVHAVLRHVTRNAQKRKFRKMTLTALPVQAHENPSYPLSHLEREKRNQHQDIPGTTIHIRHNSRVGGATIDRY